MNDTQNNELARLLGSIEAKLESLEKNGEKTNERIFEEMGTIKDDLDGLKKQVQKMQDEGGLKQTFQEQNCKWHADELKEIKEHLANDNKRIIRIEQVVQIDKVVDKALVTEKKKEIEIAKEKREISNTHLAWIVGIVGLILSALQIYLSNN